jgi:uncharacterized protein YoxC
MDDDQLDQLQAVVQKIGESVIATTDTVERLATRMDGLAHQVQQQGYQIFALSDAIQTLAENHDGLMERLDRLTQSLQDLVSAIDDEA